MAVYKVKAPDGNIIKIQGPDGASEEDVIAQAQKLYQPQKTDTTPSGNFLTNRIAKNWQSMMGNVQNVIAGSASPETLSKLNIQKPTQQQLTKSGEALTTGIAGTLGPGITSGIKQPLSAIESLRDKTLNEVRDAGYVIPPSEAGGSITSRVGQMASGKFKTEELASYLNQKTTNSLAKQALDIPDNIDLSPEVLSNIRKTAGQAYQDAANLGTLKVPSNIQPNSLWPQTISNVGGEGAVSQRFVNSKDIVEALKQLRHDGNAYLQAYGRDANPETLAKAKDMLGTASQLDDFLENAATKLNKSDIAQALKDARVTIAKSYTVQNAMNPATGDINALDIAKLMDKGKPLSGELSTIAKMGLAFPKSARAVSSGAFPNPFTTVDIGYGGALAALHNLPLAAALAGSRLTGRYASLYPNQTAAIAKMLLQNAQPIAGSIGAQLNE